MTPVCPCSVYQRIATVATRRILLCTS